MNRHYDTIIVGAGTMGAAAGYHLARAGQRVLMIDAHDPPHDQGSHHGSTRIFRHAYSSDPVYVRMALQADKGWRELEALSGIPLLQRTGVLNMYPADSPSFTGKLRAAEQFGLDVAALSASEIARQWPGIELPGHYAGLFERQAGILASEACVRAYRVLAERHGAAVLTHAPVTRIELSRGRAVVHAAGASAGAGAEAANDGTGARAGASASAASAAADAAATTGFTAEAAQLLLTTGADCARLLPGLALPVAKIRKAVGWFEADPRLFAAEEHFPAFNYEGPEGEYYGFPSVAGAGLKVGRHDGGTAVTPGSRLQPFGAEPADEGELRAFLLARLPQAAGALRQGAVCSYERTPDEHFILDRHPEHEHVFIAAGFSGHGFKFASTIGELLGEWMTTDRTEEDLSFFSLKRFL